LRFSHFLDNWLTDGSEVVSLTRRPPFTPRKITSRPVTWIALPVAVVVVVVVIIIIIIIIIIIMIDALFFIQVYRGSKFCPSVLEIVGLRVPARCIRDFTLFSVCSSSRYSSCARCASAANVVCRDIDVFGAKPVLLKDIL
jgi:hypothetical protein